MNEWIAEHREGLNDGCELLPKNPERAMSLRPSPTDCTYKTQASNPNTILHPVDN